MKLRFLSFFLWIISFPAFSQASWQDFLSRVELHTDTLSFSTLQHYSVYNGEKGLCFIYEDENTTAELAFFPVTQPSASEHFSLYPSGDFELVDSVVFLNQAWRCKVRFHNLTRSKFLKLQFRISGGEQDKIAVLRLFPCTHTTVSIKTGNDELFIGEEKVFDLITNKPENLTYPVDWTAGQQIDYRIEKSGDQLKLHVIPNILGQHILKIQFQTEKPDMDASSAGITVKTVSLETYFNVKNSQLGFLNPDKKDVTLDEESRRKGSEIILDYGRSLELNKTYRVEDQESPGGVLIAEIFTRSFVANNKVLCYLKTYNYHKASEGYLYIKNGDEAVFMTNLNITPVTSISNVSLMHTGGDWVNDLSVYPGETVQLKIEGLSLNKARFLFEEVDQLTRDTLIQNENEVNLKFTIPVNVSKKRLILYNNGAPTSWALNVKEYEVARPFDYVYINYDGINRQLDDLHGPVLYEKTIRDVVISFNNDRIDSKNKLYGRQYLTFDIRITGPNNELVDMRTIGNVVVCPSDNSPRFKYYDRRNCQQGEISLNKFLRRSTNDLDDWSRISLSVKSADRSGGEGQQKDLDIILKKRVKFDIDVSFPAGLVTVSKDKSSTDNEKFSNLYGISMAMVAQFAFYNPDKIAKLRPFRVGAGFLALDAFNFQSELQDLAMVGLFSIYPTTRNQKLAFPLYFGGGYQFKAQKWMMLIGPGISLKL
jgi:hypothetical protein